MSNLTAIETNYAGCRFRSRLEARWAVWLNHLKIEWRYEPQGFELPSGKAYLPDFYLPATDLWVEVKGDERELRADGQRYAEAAAVLGSLLILGPIPDVHDGLPQHFVLTSHDHCCGSQILCLHIAWSDMLRHPAGVREFGFLCTGLISHEPGRLPALGDYNRGRARYTDPGPVPGTSHKIVGEKDAHAYRAARAARFEHGETPA